MYTCFINKKNFIYSHKIILHIATLSIEILNIELHLQYCDYFIVFIINNA